MNKFDVKLESDRLILRKIKKDDAVDMFDYTRNPEVCRYLSWNAHTNIIQTQNYIDSVLEEYKTSDSFAWAIEIKEIQKFAGVIRIFNISFSNKRVELSCILNPKYQGKGFMTEAYTTVINYCIFELNLNRIQARCTPDNLASEKVMIKTGMNYEGTLKEFWLNKGIFTDAKIYALISETYKKSSNSKAFYKILDEK